MVGTRTLLASQRPSYLGRRRVAGAGRPGGSATPVRTRRRCRNGVRSWWPGGYMMPPHADDYLHLTQLVSLSGCTRGRRYWRVPEVLQCIGVNGGSRFLLACLPRRVRQSSGLPPLPLVPRVTFVLAWRIRSSHSSEARLQLKRDARYAMRLANGVNPTSWHLTTARGELPLEVAGEHWLRAASGGLSAPAIEGFCPAYGGSRRLQIALSQAMSLPTATAKGMEYRSTFTLFEFDRTFEGLCQDSICV